MLYCVLFFFKQKTAYEMRISDWSSDVCSSDLGPQGRTHSQLLSNGEIARARSAAGLRIHDDLLPCEGGPGIRRMDESCCNAGGGSGRQSVVIWHLAALWEAKIGRAHV